jgi:tight adherence protein B
VAELDAGAPATGAVQVAAAGLGHDPVLAALARHVSLGGDVVDALNEAAAAPRAGALRKVAACLKVTAQSGAGLGSALRRVSDGIRDELALAREVAGQLAAPRATAKLLAGLPVMVWLMGYGLGADPLTVLFTTPYGGACLVVGVGLEAVGLVWVEHQARAVTGE